MARARNIKPGFFANEDLAECSFPARLCFAGLWTLADREGRLEDRPKRIKGELFRFDSIEVEPLLTELEEHGFLVRYQIAGAALIQILMFRKHQTPHYSEKPSVIKPPPLREFQPNIRQESGGHEDTETPRTLPDHSKNRVVIKGGSQPPDSLNPDSLNHESLSLAQTQSPSAQLGTSPSERDASVKPKAKSARQKNPKATVHGFPPGFERFWTAYPRKVGKDKAAHAFAQRKPDTALVDAMVAAVEVQKHGDQWCREGGRFIPYPSTWLNAAQWLDEDGGGPSGGGITPELADMFRRGAT